MAHAANRRVLPGFGLSIGFSLLYLSALVLVPLTACYWRASSLTWAEFAAAALDERSVNAYKLTFGTSLVAAALSVGVGLLIAWVLVRYEFPGRRVMDALVDLPFALPTAVAGLVFASLYDKHGWLGSFLVPLGVDLLYTPTAIVLMLVFIGFPFVVRAVQPVLETIDAEVEEAAAALGATRWQTFRRVLLPGLMPSLVTGFALSFARALGEYGSVVFIAGNTPNKTEIASVLVVMRLEEFKYAEATAVAVVLLTFSFAMLLVINLLERWNGDQGA